MIDQSYLANPDPLGIGLRQRAEADRRQLNPTGLGGFGPLRDPMWDGLFQALHESGAKNVGDNSLGVYRGMWSAPQPMSGGYNETMSGPLGGLMMSHEQWKQQDPAAQAYTKGKVKR